MNGLSTKSRANLEPEAIATTPTLEAAVATSNTTNKRPINSVDLRPNTTSSGQDRKSSRINSTTKSEALKITSLSSTSAEAATTRKTATSPKLLLGPQAAQYFNPNLKSFPRQRIPLMSFTKSEWRRTAPQCRCFVRTKTLRSRNFSRDRSLTSLKR